MKRILIIVSTIFAFTSLLNTSLVKTVFTQQRTPEPPPPRGLEMPVPQLPECKEDEVLKDGKCVRKFPSIQREKARQPESSPPSGPEMPVPQLE